MKGISSDFDAAIRTIKNKYSNAGCPMRFIRSIVNNLNVPPKVDVSVIIPPNFFDEKKPFLLIEFPYCEMNKTALKYYLIKKFHQFKNERYDVAIKRLTRK